MNTLLNHMSVHFCPFSTLYEEETDLLVSVANRFIEKYPESARGELRGSFRLIGLPKYGDAQNIMSFDFPGGTNTGHPDYSSADLVTFAIERAKSDLERTAPIADASYKSKYAETIRIQTKYGCFIMAISMIPRDLSRPFMLEIATAIQQLGYAFNCDRTLQFSVESLHIPPTYRDDINSLEYELLGNYFSSEEMQKWQRWHRSHIREKGDLGFFFEESVRNERAAGQNRYTQPLTQPVVKLRA